MSKPNERHDKFFFITGVVFFIFLVFWTPHHVDRIMYIIITMTNSWTDVIADAQEWIHLVAGIKR